jgi:hypothetical protein
MAALRQPRWVPSPAGETPQPYGLFLGSWSVSLCQNVAHTHVWVSFPPDALDVEMPAGYGP